MRATPFARPDGRGFPRARLKADRTLNVQHARVISSGAHRAACYFSNGARPPSPPSLLAVAADQPAHRPAAPASPRTTNASPASWKDRIRPPASSATCSAPGWRFTSARASADELPQRSTSRRPPPLDAPYYVFLLSREGPPTAHAQAALFAAQEADTRDGLEPAAAEFATCAPEAARQLLQGRAGSFKLKSSQGRPRARSTCTTTWREFKSDLL